MLLWVWLTRGLGAVLTLVNRKWFLLKCLGSAHPRPCGAGSTALLAPALHCGPSPCRDLRTHRQSRANSEPSACSGIMGSSVGAVGRPRLSSPALKGAGPVPRAFFIPHAPPREGRTRARPVSIGHGKWGRGLGMGAWTLQGGSGILLGKLWHSPSFKDTSSPGSSRNLW